MYSPRLRTTANYSQFHPQALACQTLAPSTSAYTSSHSDNHYSSIDALSSSSSLAAISSSNGILLFSTHAPYEPTLLLSQYSYSPNPTALSSTSSSIFHVAFSTQNSQNKLASTNSNSVFIWDTTGQSLHPLITRISNRHNQPDRLTSSSTSSSSSFIALEWNKHNDTILTATQNSISIWDIRSPTTATTRIRPSSTFYKNAKQQQHQSTISSIAASYKEHEFASIDTDGYISIYDDRINQFNHKRGRSDINTMNDEGFVQIWGHEVSGIGIESMQFDHDMYTSASTSTGTKSNHSASDLLLSQHGFVSWGLDSSEDGLICKTVKVWTHGKANNNHVPFDTDSYWYMGEDASKNNTNNKNHTRGGDNDNRNDGGLLYQCYSKFAVDQLTSVRVCPNPFKNGIVTFSSTEDDNSNSSRSRSSSWKIDLWCLTSTSSNDKEETSSPSSFSSNIENMASFRSDNENLNEVLGEKFDTGHLIAAELALGSAITSLDRHKQQSSSSPPSPSKNYHDDANTKRNQDNNDDDGDDNDDNDDVELLICCLGSNGYITTHAVPEAMLLQYKKSNTPKDDNEAANPFYFQYHNGSSENPKNAMKIFQQSSSDPDLASKNLEGDGRGRRQSDADLYYDVLNQNNKTPTGTTDQLTTFSMFKSSSIDGGFVHLHKKDLYYDEDTELVEDGGLAKQKTQVAPSSEDLVLIDKAKSDEGNLVNKIDPVKAIRVPCPRLCGATFGIGGGLISFHNGEVKKMWNWFSNLDGAAHGIPSKMKKILSADSLDAFQDFNNEGSAIEVSLTDKHEVKNKEEKVKNFPRTMCDLMNMNKAAKFAQWGDEGEDDGGEDEQSRDSVDDSSPSSETDESDGSGDDDDSSDDSSSLGYDFDDSDLDPKQSTNMLFENFFGKNASFGLPDYSTAPNIKARNIMRQRSDSFHGPTTESLSPVIFYTTRFDEIVLNGQSPRLADLWILGPWANATDERLKRIEGNKTFSTSSVAQKIPEPKERTSFQSMSKAFSINKGTKSISKDPICNSNSSDPLLQMTMKKEKRKQSLLGNLQKLYNYDQIGNTPTYSSSVPIDQKIFDKYSSEKQNINVPTEDIGTPTVITVAPSHELKPDRDCIRRLKHAKDICIHNATSCRDVGQHGKEKVWYLLAEVFDNMTSASEGGDEFDGWKGFVTLGRNLLQGILKYYENQGDVQMLGTIISVISVGKTEGYHSGIMKDYQLLSPEDANRCDIYIHLYANMLYSWGRIETCAELNKHLCNSLSHAHLAEESRGLMFGPCLSCGKPLSFGANICHSCNDHAFRCSICTNPVKGLFTVCIYCGHGGHMQHISDWFENHSVCPTACGCSCKFKTISVDSYENGLPLEGIPISADM